MTINILSIVFLAVVGGVCTFRADWVIAFYNWISVRIYRYDDPPVANDEAQNKKIKRQGYFLLFCAGVITLATLASSI